MEPRRADGTFKKKHDKMNKIIILLSKLFILLCLFSCTSQTAIIYEPIGIMDKPLPKIEIGNCIGNDRETKYFVLDKQIIDKLSRSIEDNLSYTTTDTVANREFGIYKITILKNGSKSVFLLKSRKESVVFFQNQLKILDNNTDVYKEFELLIKRINW